MAAVRVSRAAWPHLQRNGGSIVNIAGVGARSGSAEFTIGGSVNSAMLNLTKALADRGVKEGVRVNAIGPGPTLPSTYQDRAAFEAEARGTLLARAVPPGEIGQALRYLIDAKSVTGQMIAVDAGQHLS